MIDITDVQKVLNDEPNENTICYEYELRPTIIVSDIKKLANINTSPNIIIIIIGIVIFCSCLYLNINSRLRQFFFFF